MNGADFYLSSLSEREVESLQPLPGGGSSSANVLRQVAGHLFLYTVLAALLHAGLWSWKRGTAHRLKWALVIAALATLYGVSDELHQSTVTDRSASIIDALVNLVGALIAAGTMSYLGQTPVQGRSHASRRECCRSGLMVPSPSSSLAKAKK